MGWKSKRIDSLCEVFTDGNWIETKDQSTNGIRLIQTGNVGQGVFKDRQEKARYISEDTFVKLKCFEIYEGDCLISRLPDPVGRACLIPNSDERMITSVDCTVLRFKKDLLHPEFFNYFSQSYDYLRNVDSRTTGATRKRISRKNLGMVEIPLPPLPEQKRIVAILDKAFAAIDEAKAKTEQNLKNARELFDSHLNQIFHSNEMWLEKDLGEICDLFQGLAINKKTKHLLVEKSSLPLLRIKDLRDGTEEQYVKEDGFPEKARVFEDDIIYTRTGNSLGLVFKGRSGILHNNSFKVVPNELIQRSYLFWWLQHSKFTDEIFRLAYRAAQPDITHVIFKAQKIKIPPNDFQVEAVKKIEKLKEHSDQLISIYEEKERSLGSLKKSLLQKAFSGELTAKPAEEAVA